VDGLFDLKALWCFAFSDGFVDVGWHGLGVDSGEVKNRVFELEV
jgi:hypothetical protein